MKYVPLEKIMDIFYKDFNHPDKNEAMEFFKERNLASFDGLGMFVNQEEELENTYSNFLTSGTEKYQ